MTKSIDEITAEVNSFVGKLNQDLQISTPSKLFDPSPFKKVTLAMSGLTAELRSPFSGIIANAITHAAEHERSLAEVAALANLTMAEVVDFYQTHPYSLETIKAALQAGAKLNEEDIKRVMEPKYIPMGPVTKDSFKLGIFSTAETYTFTVTLPNSDRREIKAAYMEVDGGCLYFEDDNRETILAFGPGHWVWAERKEEDE